MAAKKLDRAGDAARQIREHPIVGRLLEDADLRDALRSAYDSSRSAYARLNGSKSPGKALLEDKKLQRELRSTADSLRNVSDSFRTPPKRRRGGLGKLIVVTFVGAVAAVALSEGLRSKLLDLLFGAEEEFDYSSTTTPVSPPTPVPDPPASSATTVQAPVPVAETAPEAGEDAAAAAEDVPADSEATATSN